MEENRKHGKCENFIPVFLGIHGTHFHEMDKMSDCRTFSLIQGVVIGLPG